MDIRTGKIYESFEDARKADVPESDIAFVQQVRDQIPIVKFTKGSFKSFIRNEAGELVQK